MSSEMKTFSEIPNWKLQIEEISSGVYKIVGKDSNGISIELTTHDPEAALEDIKKAAIEKSLSVANRFDERPD